MRRLSYAEPLFKIALIDSNLEFTSSGNYCENGDFTEFGDV